MGSLGFSETTFSPRCFAYALQSGGASQPAPLEAKLSKRGQPCVLKAPEDKTKAGELNTPSIEIKRLQANEAECETKGCLTRENNGIKGAVTILRRGQF